MKKFSWIFALILALSMAFVFTGCPGPDEDPAPTPPPGPTGPTGPTGPGGEWSGTPDPTAPEISVVFEEEFAQKGAGSLSYADGGYTYTYGTGANTGYGNAIVRFKINLGAKHLGDYGGFSFKWTGISGDVGLSPADPSYTKNLFILASADEADVTPYRSDDQIKSVIVNTDYFVANASANLYSGSAGVPGVKGPGTFLVTTPVVQGKALTGEIWLAFYFHAEDGSYSISDFKLVPFANFEGQDVVEDNGGATEGTKLKVKLGSATVDTTVVPGNNGTIKYAVGDGAYTYTYGTVDNSNYGNAISRFKIDLGYKDITDFKEVKVTYTGIDGDAADNKKLYLLASKTESAITPWQSDANVKALVVSDDPGGAFWNGSGPQVNGEEEQTVTLNILSTDTTLTGEVWFAIYMHATDGAYTIGNVEFVRGEIKIPSAATVLKVDLGNWYTIGTTAGGLNANLPTGFNDGDKLTVTFTENGQRVNFKLTDDQVAILDAARAIAGNTITTIIEGEVTGSGDSFRYHIGAPGEGGNWNATSGSGDNTLANILKTEQTFNSGNAALAGRLEYFILQHRSADSVTIEISSIIIGVIYDGALTDDGPDPGDYDVNYALKPVFTGWGDLSGTGNSFDFKETGNYGCIIGYEFPAEAADYDNFTLYYSLEKLSTGETTKPMKLAIKNDVLLTGWGGDVGDYPQQSTDGDYTYEKTVATFTKALLIQMNVGSGKDESADYKITITKIVFSD